MLAAVLLWLALVALWAVGGALVGALGRLAAPATWAARGWRAPLAAGVTGALAGGLLGALLAGRVFGSPAAACGAALAVALRLTLAGRSWWRFPHHRAPISTRP
jgi:predicted lipid-binding transport protein (Tim44 family)